MAACEVGENTRASPLEGHRTVSSESRRGAAYWRLSQLQRIALARAPRPELSPLPLTSLALTDPKHPTPRDSAPQAPFLLFSLVRDSSDLACPPLSEPPLQVDLLSTPQHSTA